MGYWYYNTHVVCHEKMAEKFLEELNEKCSVNLYATYKFKDVDEHDGICFVFHEMKHYENLVRILFKLKETNVESSEYEGEWDYKVLTEGENDGDFICEADYENYDLFEEFYFDLKTPKMKEI